MTAAGPRAVIVICDSLRADLITPTDTPFLVELSERAAYFAAHRSVFPSTTRASAASIATGCLPARHGLLGNTMALDEGEGLVCRSAGHPDFPDRLRRATGRTLHVPTLAERLRRHGAVSISCANVSPGAAYFQDPDGHGFVYHAAGSYGPGRRPLDDPASAALKKGTAGDRAMTERFCAEILEERAPALAIMWLSEPDYTGHHSPLGSPEHRSAIAGADRCARQVFETVRRLDPSGDRILFITGSDHGMETITRAIDLDALLIGAGLKRGPQSRDVVVDRLAAVGLPTNSAMRIAVTLAGEDCANPHGVRGYCPIVQDPADSESKVGFGQHGGLGPNEQRPFLMIEGGGFAPGPRHEPTSLIDIAPTVLRHLHMAHDDMDGRALPRVGG